MNNSIKKLEPKPLWNNFSKLNEVPRASKKEGRVIEFMKNFGESLGLKTVVDSVGNVIIKKPASAGMENRKTLVLQSHLDMVHQKNSEVTFDFETEGIRCFVDGEWVKAEGTTLGADNGIGVASIMTLLESKDIPHPPLEALFTIDEETGMSGAKGLIEGLLEGDILLNLDTEDDDELCIGCAGGIDTNTYLKYKEKKPKADRLGYQIAITGLKGGHSGVDIHLGRANANKLMNRLLYGTAKPFGLRIATIDGGSLRNAIPRESFAVVVVAEKRLDAFLKEFDKRVTAIKSEFKSIEPNLSITISSATLPEKVMSRKAQGKILNAIYAMPNGVFRMSPDIPDLVETSSSLARVIVKDGEFITQSLQRSSVESGKTDIANAVKAAFKAIGAKVENGNSYPGWEPNAQSPILKTMENLYAKLFDEKPKVAACHAGLECGIILDHYPNMDTISFGPTIKHPHSPDEMVNIQSVGKFWKFLLHTLKEAPNKN